MCVENILAPSKKKGTINANALIITACTVVVQRLLVLMKNPPVFKFLPSVLRQTAAPTGIRVTDQSAEDKG